MEIEMKAKITLNQAKDLIEGKNLKGYKICRGGGWTPLYKSDDYYSFNGESLSSPTNIVRIRKESLIDDEFIFEDIVRGLALPSSSGKTFLTIKRKNTAPDGTETNEEYEDCFEGSSPEGLMQLLGVANFKPYFHKVKTSASFYVEREKDGKEMHCEIVNVNRIGPYLEIEIVEDDESKIVDAKALIKDFFKEVLNITTFDARSWKTIIKEDSE